MRDRSDFDVVLLSADSLETIKRTHSSYFDTRESFEAPRRGLIDRLRGRVTVNVGHRVDGHATPYVTSSTLGRHPVREMRELAHA